jgi:cell division protein FtsI/penicillin-binding protein 2
VWDAGGNVVWRSQRKVVRRVLRPEVSRSTVEVLQQVVDGEQGTGKACRMEKWTSFGKTGTAQIAKGSVYVPGAFTGTFVGGAPASKPELVCLISIYWPTRGGHYGATVAAPYVKEVLEKSLSYLEVPPDRPLDSNVASAR